MARRATGCGVLLFTGLALAACGGSSSGGGATPSAASTTPATVSASATPDTAAPTTPAPTTQPAITQVVGTLPATITLADLPGRLAASSATCGAAVVPPSSDGHWLYVCTMRPDGTDVQQLSTAQQNAFNLNWSYDGTHFVFSDANTTTIVVDLATGAQHQRKAGDPNGLYDSPDNNWKLFIGADGVSIGHPTVKGSSTPLIADPNVDPVATPSWAPDSRRFAYLSLADGKGGRLACNEVWIGAADGTPPVQITHSATGSGGPEACPDEVRWSPDGATLLLHTSGTSQNGSANIYLLHPDGTGLTALTHAAENTPDPDSNGVFPAVGASFSPVWSPNSKYIAFSRNDGAAYGLYVLRADGTGITPVPAPTGLVAGVSELAWAPS